MKMLKLLLPLALGLLLLSGCKKEATYTVNIISPAAGALAQDTSVVISVEFTTTDELHDTEIELTENGNAVPPFPSDIHEHGNSYLFEQTIDLSSYPSGTTFTLTAKTCPDHGTCADGDWVEESRMFSIP